MFTSVDVFALPARSIESRAQRAGMTDPLDMIESAFAAFVEETPAGFDTIKDAWNTFLDEGNIKSNAKQDKTKAENTNDMPVIEVTPITFDSITMPTNTNAQTAQQLSMF